METSTYGMPWYRGLLNYFKRPKIKDTSSVSKSFHDNKPGGGVLRKSNRLEKVCLLTPHSLDIRDYS